jgi:hypothetical protein
MANVPATIAVVTPATPVRNMMVPPLNYVSYNPAGPKSSVRYDLGVRERERPLNLSYAGFVSEPG